MHASEQPTLSHLTTASLLAWRVAQSADDVAVRWFESGHWKTATWRQYECLVRRIARRLEHLGCTRGTRVAVFAETSFEWALVDLAVQRCGAAVVAIHPAYSVGEAAYALAVSGATLLFVGGAGPHETLPRVNAASGRDLTIYSFDSGPYALPGIKPFRELLDATAGEQVLAASGAADPHVDARETDLATIVFTSGTAGMPKGVCLTQKNLVATALAGYEHIGLRLPQPHAIHWLPFGHLFGRIGIYMDMVGGSVATYSRGLRDLAADIAVAQPHFLCLVPKALRRFESVIRQNVARLPAWKQKVFAGAVRIALRAVRDNASSRRTSPWRFVHALLKATVFRAVVDRFGSNLRLIIVGSAPTEPDLCAFFQALGIEVCEGYGMTETSGVAFVNPYGRTKRGTVGSPIDTVQFRIDSDHELLLKGASVFQGYLSPDHDREAFTEDGWFRTGDLAAIVAGEHLRVIGRKKDILITDGGENVAPERLEGRLAAHPAIADAAVFGDRRPYLVAVLSIDPAVAPVTTAMLQRAIDEVNRGVAGFERIRRFFVASEPFSVENGELTLTLKKRRAAIEARYRDDIDQLYAADPIIRPAPDRRISRTPAIASRCVESN
jgi:long-chain acyl-CoA synthetase